MPHSPSGPPPYHRILPTSSFITWRLSSNLFGRSHGIITIRKLFGALPFMAWQVLAAITSASLVPARVDGALHHPPPRHLLLHASPGLRPSAPMSSGIVLWHGLWSTNWSLPCPLPHPLLSLSTSGSFALPFLHIPSTPTYGLSHVWLPSMPWNWDAATSGSWQNQVLPPPIFSFVRLDMLPLTFGFFSRIFLPSSPHLSPGTRQGPIIPSSAFCPGPNPLGLLPHQPRYSA